MRVGINGFGRIGRQFLRIAATRKEVDVVHINDLASPESLAYLLKHDSIHGTYRDSVSVTSGAIRVGSRSIPVTAAREAAEVPWRASEVDVVIESSGSISTRAELAKHLDAGARKVLLAAPGAELDAIFVVGVNDKLYDASKQAIMSIGSCTTNALAPVAKVLHDSFGIERGFINTVHAYTGSQSLVDQPNADPRRARAAAVNIVPTSTGAAKSIGLVIPELNGRLDGLALRVPVPDGSIVDLTCVVSKRATPADINTALEAASNGAMKGILRVSAEPLVSSDVIGDPHSSIVEAFETRVLGDHLIKVLAWYDNEWAFANRLVDMVAKL